MTSEQRNDPAPLIVTDLHKSHGQGSTTVNALKGVSLQLEAGTLTAIMGPSGSGKSTLLHCSAGLSLPDRGSVELAGQTINELDDNKRSALRRQKLGMIFQSFNLVPTLTALDNIALPLILDGGNEQAARDKAAGLLSALVWRLARSMCHPIFQVANNSGWPLPERSLPMLHWSSQMNPPATSIAKAESKLASYSKRSSPASNAPSAWLPMSHRLQHGQIACSFSLMGTS